MTVSFSHSSFGINQITRVLELTLHAYWKHWQYWHWRGCGMKMTERGQPCYISKSPLFWLKQHKNSDKAHVQLIFLTEGLHSIHSSSSNAGKPHLWCTRQEFMPLWSTISFSKEYWERHLSVAQLSLFPISTCVYLGYYSNWNKPPPPPHCVTYLFSSAETLMHQWERIFFSIVSAPNWNKTIVVVDGHLLQWAWAEFNQTTPGCGVTCSSFKVTDSEVDHQPAIHVTWT